MLKLSHLTIRHTKDLRDLVRDLSLTIHEGEKSCYYWRRREWKIFLTSSPYVPKISTRLSDHRRRNHH